MKNLGRPKKLEDEKKITVAYCLSKISVEFINKLSKENNSSRSEALDSLILENIRAYQ